MRDDGGSHTNIYYQLDLDKNTMMKCEDEYVGFKGYKYEGKILYKKNLTETERQKLKEILDNLINNGEEKTEKFYYTISSFNNEDIKIYDKEIINNLEDLLSNKNN